MTEKKATPLFSMEAEKAVLGSILMESAHVLDLCAMSGLSSESFNAANHRATFEEIMALNHAGIAADCITLGNRLKDVGKLEMLGGLTFLDELVDSVLTVAHVEHWIDIVLEYQRKRKLSEMADSIKADLVTEEDSFSITSRAEAALMQTNVEQRTDPTPEEVVKLVLNNWEAARSTGLRGVPSGFAHLRRLMGGYAEYTIMAGRPGQGKSTLMLCEALYQASQGYPVGIASLEMSSDQCYRRIACNRADVSMYALDHGIAGTGQEARALNSLVEVSKMPLYVSEQSHTPESLASWARRQVMKNGIQILWVDYLQILCPSQRYSGMTERITDFSGMMLRLRKQLKIPVVVLSQLSRLSDRENRPPKLSDLRDSGAIEQDAHTVIFVSDHQDEAMKDDLSVVSVDKNRDGALGRGELKKNFARQRFEEMDIQPGGSYEQ